MYKFEITSSSEHLMNLLTQNLQQLKTTLQVQFRSQRTREQIQHDLNQFLLTLSQQLVFQQPLLEQSQLLLQTALDQYSLLGITPALEIWKLYMLDYMPTSFNAVFSKQLMAFYNQLTECSPIFKSPIFNSLYKLSNLLLTITTWDKEVSEEFRNSKCLRSVIRMLRVNPSEELLLLLCVSSKNTKNAEYMTIKRSQDCLVQHYKANYFKDLVSIIIANMCFSTDQRLLFWCTGLMQQIRPIHQSSTLALIWRFIYDAAEVVEELLANQDFCASLPNFCTKISEETAFAVGIIRKICENNKPYKDKNVQLIISVFRQLLELPQTAQTPPNVYYFIYKEIFSFLGIVGASFVSQQYVPLVCQTIINNLVDSKVLTTGIGCLTNLSVVPQIQECIHSDRTVFQLILLILEQYHDKTQLIDYTLKLMINTIPNKAAALQYGQPRVLMKLLFIWHINPLCLTSCPLVVRIFRGLYQIHNQFMEMLVQCINEIQSQNPAFNFMEVVIKTANEYLKHLLFDFVLELFLLLSIIPGLELNRPNFQACIRTYVEKMRNAGELKKALQVVSTLPIEEIGLQL